MERGGDEYHTYKKALKMAKKAINKLCELTEEMEEEYDFEERDHSDEWDGVEERKMRKKKGSRDW